MSKQIQYIDFTGTQYIDTGIVPDGNTTLEIDCILLSHPADSARPLYGSRTAQGSSDAYCLWYMSGGNFRLDVFDKQFNCSSTYTPVNRHVYRITPTGMFSDNNSVVTYSQLSKRGSIPLVIGAVNTNNEFRYGSYRVYSCKIYNDGILVRDYVPYKDDNNRYCFKENVNNTFVYSATQQDLSGGV